MPVENGSEWVRPLVEQAAEALRAHAEGFDEDPMVAFTGPSSSTRSTRRTRSGSSKLIGADNVVFGSDFPHPEGMYDPVSFVDELEVAPRGGQGQDHGWQPQPLMKVALAA